MTLSGTITPVPSRCAPGADRTWCGGNAPSRHQVGTKFERARIKGIGQRPMALACLPSTLDSPGMRERSRGASMVPRPRGNGRISTEHGNAAWSTYPHSITDEIGLTPRLRFALRDPEQRLRLPPPPSIREANQGLGVRRVEATSTPVASICQSRPFSPAGLRLGAAYALATPAAYAWRFSVPRGNRGAFPPDGVRRLC